MALPRGASLTNLFQVALGTEVTMEGLILMEGSNLFILQSPTNGQAVIVLGDLIAKDCVFKDNLSHNGGAIYCHQSGSNVTLTDCQFLNNEGRMGGALHVNNDCNFQIEGCDFIGNTSNTGVGGAIFNNQSEMYILNCNFQGNSSVSSVAWRAEGGAICFSGIVNSEISNSVFNGNHCDGPLGGLGGAISVNTLGFQIAKLDFNSLTIANNYAPEGGGIAIRSTEKFNIGNCILANNFSNPGIDPDLYFDWALNNPVSKGGNLISIAPTSFSPQIQDLFGTQVTPIDPEFMQLGSFPPSTDGDYHIAPCSPAMNTGRNSILPWDDFNYFGQGTSTPISEDIEGINRLILNVDKGAYEHVIFAPGAFYYDDGETHCKDKGFSHAVTGGVTGWFTSAPAGLYIDQSTGMITRKFSAAGQYAVTFNTFGCNGLPVTNTILYTINPNPTVSIYQYVNGGGPFAGASLGAIVSGTSGPYDYEWKRLGVVVSTSEIVSNPCSRADYELTVTDQITGCQGYATYWFSYRNNSVCYEEPPLEMGFNKYGNSENDIESVSASWELFPNPSEGEFSIQLDQDYESVDVAITDLTGKVIYSSNDSNSGRLTLKLDQPAGMYFVRVSTGAQSEVFRVVLK